MASSLAVRWPLVLAALAVLLVSSVIAPHAALIVCGLLCAFAPYLAMLQQTLENPARRRRPR